MYFSKATFKSIKSSHHLNDAKIIITPATIKIIPNNKADVINNTPNTHNTKPKNLGPKTRLIANNAINIRIMYNISSLCIWIYPLKTLLASLIKASPEYLSVSSSILSFFFELQG